MVEKVARRLDGWKKVFLSLGEGGGVGVAETNPMVDLVLFVSHT